MRAHSTQEYSLPRRAAADVGRGRVRRLQQLLAGVEQQLHRPRARRRCTNAPGKRFVTQDNTATPGVSHRQGAAATTHDGVMRDARRRTTRHVTRCARIAAVVAHDARHARPPMPVSTHKCARARVCACVLVSVRVRVCMRACVRVYRINSPIHRLGYLSATAAACRHPVQNTGQNTRRIRGRRRGRRRGG